MPLLCAAAFCVTLVCAGGFYEYGAMAAGILLGAAWWMLLKEKHPPRRVWRPEGKWNIPLLVPVLLIASALPVTFFAADRPMHLAGVLKLMPLLLWLYLCVQMPRGDRETLRFLIPCAGVFMVAAGMLSLLTERTKALFWMADRLGGTFQYANTCALFLSAGVLLLMQPRGANAAEGEGRLCRFLAAPKIRIPCIVVLLVGVFLTGSRSILVLLLVFALYQAVRHRTLRKPVLIVASCGVGAAAAVAFLSGNVQNIGRIFTLFSYSSTFLGRLLYMKDALLMIPHFPLGAGFSGYSYIQNTYQNGLYTTRYVHNDFLQAALDLGILPALALIAYLVWQLVRGRQGREQKEILLFLLLAALFDFHFQFLSILMTAVLFLDLSRERVLREGDAATPEAAAKRKGGLRVGSRAGKRRDSGRGARAENMVCAVLCALAFAYFLIPFAAFAAGSDATVLRFYPHYTESERRLLEAAQSAEEAERLAREILGHNTYLAAPYRHLGYAALMRGDVETALDQLDRVITINRYRIEEYEAYDALLESLLASQGNPALSPELRERVRQTREALPGILAGLRDTTDPLAFRLRDLPVFEMDGE